MDDDLKARLLKLTVPEATVLIEGVGEIRVRGLRRGEVFAIKKTTQAAADGRDLEGFEVKLITVGVLEPKLTEAEVRRLYKTAAAGIFDPIVDKITELSGLSQGADKSDLPGVRDGE